MCACLHVAVYVCMPCLQVQAARSLIHFSDSGKEESVSQYLPELLPRLFDMLRDGRKCEKEFSITAIASLADSSMSSFEPFFDHFMPVLIWIAESQTDPEYRVVRGRAMECLSILGSSVPVERFRCGWLFFLFLISVTTACAKRTGAAASGDCWRGEPAWAIARV
jgi:hypothetical protein